VPKTPPPLLKEIGRQIRTVRKAKGWSQEQLAAEAGIDRSYMSGIERGVRNISVLKLASLAQVLGTRLSDLLPK
jgi:transcriptional regulator with XRE-family HTH domain